MMKDKVVTAEQAVSLVRDRDTLSSVGFVQSCVPEALLKALERRYLETGSPKNLSLFATAGQGDSKTKGLSRLGHPGLLRKVVAGNWGRMPSVCQLALDNKIYGYNLPQGTIAQLFRDLAGGKPGTFSKIGLHTFVDPRHGGGRINDVTTRDIVKLVDFEGEEWLFYKVAPVTVAFIRGTTADPAGNITMEKEPLTLNNLAMAMAAKNSNGIVIAQVERIAERNTLPPREVKVPGIFVDCVVVAPPEDHMTNLATQYHPGFAGRIRVPVATVPPLKLDERKIMARRAAFELPPNGIVNLGVGVPEGVASVANEEKVLQYITLSVESGAIGGIPASGPNFGASVNMDALIDENQQFDFYDGGGLDLACLGMAECDRVGNVNVSRFGTRLIGVGGFINISQNARRVVFTGTFTAGGLEVAVEDGKLKIIKEGRNKKFVDKVGQISFSGQYAYERGRMVLYVTERCVFRRVRAGLALIEVAPGIDIERDILAHMDFKPIIGEPDLMDLRIFRPEPMGLDTHLLNLDLPDRITYDPQRNILFLNFEGMYIRVKDDIVQLRRLLEERCKKIGKRVGVFINYDNFRISEDTYDDYAEMDRYMLDHYYTKITRFATSAFMRMKLGEAFTRRNIAP
ncbi:MAG: malonate decarboxylase subunit alpha, partial [Xanthobacteraceae bacterium]